MKYLAISVIWALLGVTISVSAKNLNTMNSKSLQSQSSLGGDSSAGGGDPKEVQAVPFPNITVLRTALAKLAIRINSTEYPTVFKSQIIQEMNKLMEQDKYLYVPELGSLGYRRFSGDYKTLVAMGAFTPFSAGEPIYLSKQVEKYSADQLALVIAQELPHHVIPGALRFDEDFVNPLGESLASGKTNSQFLRKLEEVYSISKSQIVCRGEIRRMDYSSGLRGSAKTSSNVELRFSFNMDKGRSYKSWADVTVPVYDAVVEERVYTEGMNPEAVSPIIHKNVELKVNTANHFWYAKELHLSLGLPRFVDSDGDGFINANGEGSGLFSNKREENFDKNYRSANIDCHFQLK